MKRLLSPCCLLFLTIALLVATCSEEALSDADRSSPAVEAPAGSSPEPGAAQAEDGEKSTPPSVEAEQQEVEPAQEDDIAALQRRAEDGDARAHATLAGIYGWGTGVAKDPDRAFTHATVAAEKEDAVGVYELANCYKNGSGVSQDKAKAEELYRRAAGLLEQAAKGGDAMAQSHLARIYYNGEGVPRNTAEAARWQRLAAEGGYSVAQFYLGFFYELGSNGVPKDVVEAVRWYRLAAEQGNARAQSCLGEMYENGEGVEKDEAEAVRWYRLAAEQGDADAQFSLGERYARDLGVGETVLFHQKVATGEGVERDAAEAARWYRLAAEQGHASAQFSLGWMYANGRGVPKDEAETVRWYRMAAEQGHTVARWRLGWMYTNGRGVEKDEAEAVRWYRLAAEEGDADDKDSLGRMYAKGRDVEEDFAEAVRWYRMAAEQGGGGYRQFFLGFMYAMGNGVEKDKAEAARWLRLAAETDEGRLLMFSMGSSFLERGIYKTVAALMLRMAAEGGHIEAQSLLGFMNANGQGVEKDGAEAARWYRMAADQGNVGAQSYLGWAYAGGEGVPKDEAEAVRWYRMAAEQGDDSAQFYLGAAYYNGAGVVKNEVEAYKWFLLAGAQGNEYAKENIKILEDRLTSNQRAEGQRLARNFRPRETDGGEKNQSAGEGLESPSSAGTGFLITADGYLITNHHVVKGGEDIRVQTSSGLKRAKLISTDRGNDLALLKIEGTFTPLPVVSSRRVKLGQTALTVGFPNTNLQGFSPKLAKGEIAGLTGVQDDPRLFQISAPIQPGNSGGPLVDERGNVVGVVVAKLGVGAALEATGHIPENVNYAVKSSYLLSFLESAPGLAAKLLDPNDGQPNYSEAVKRAEAAAVMVLVR